MSLSDGEWLATFPSIEFKVSNSDVFFCVPPEQYYFTLTSKALRIGFFKDPSFVIGANAMAGFNFRLSVPSIALLAFQTQGSSAEL
jgi:hypothetical protein